MTPVADPQLLLRRERRFRFALMAVMAAILVAWMVLGVVKPPAQPDNYTNGYSYSPGGHAALIQLLKQNGRSTRVAVGDLRLPAFDDSSGNTLVLLEPRPEFVDEHEEVLKRLFVEALARPCSLVVALPKRFYNPEDPDSGIEVISEHDYDKHQVTRLLQVAGLDELLDVERSEDPVVCSPESAPQRWSFEVPQPAQVFVFKKSPARWDHSRPPEVLLASQHGEPIAIRVFGRSSRSRGGLVLVSDPDMFSNRWLGVPGAARTALHVFAQTPPAGELIFEETLHGFSTDASVEYLALTPPGLWVTLSLLLLLGLFGWREATVLRPMQSEAQDRRARLYAVDGLARMMLRTRDHGAAYRALMRRAGLALGQDSATVMAQGTSGSTGTRRRDTGRIRHAAGADEEQRLVNAAAMLAGRMKAESSPATAERKQQ